MDDRQKNLIEVLSKKYNVSESQVKEITSSTFTFIRKTISEFEFTGDETEEEFYQKAKNFNIPSLGKIYSIYYNFKRIHDAKRKKGRSDE